MYASVLERKRSTASLKRFLVRVETFDVATQGVALSKTDFMYTLAVFKLTLTLFGVGASGFLHPCSVRRDLQPLT